MKIAVTTESLRTPKRIGIGVVTSCFIQEYRKMFPKDTIQELIKPLRIPQTLECTYHALRNNTDIFHSTSGFLTFIHPRSHYVITMHDVIPLMYPYSYDTFSRLSWKLFAKKNCEMADQVITISHFSKQKIIDMLGIPEEKIVVSYPGVTPCDPPQDSGSIVKALGLEPYSYALYVGSINERKNVARAVKALKKWNPRVPVVITSNTPRNHPDAQLPWNCVDKYFEYLEPDILSAVYSLARFLFYPSVMEGFGLPPAEAMALGCPVACSNAASLPEVVGDAAALFNPYDEKSMIEAFDEVNSARSYFIEKGFVQVSQFKWSSFVDTVHSTYEAAVS